MKPRTTKIRLYNFQYRHSQPEQDCLAPVFWFAHPRNFFHPASSQWAVKFSKYCLLCLALAGALLSATPLFPGAFAQTAPTARLAQTDARLTRLENLLFDLVNAERTKAGLKPLLFDSTLSEIARAHSAEMRDLKYFAHESPTPGLHMPLDRFRLGTGTTPHLLAENVFRAWGGRRTISDDQAQRAHSSLMNSPGHRANILHTTPTRIGIGFVANASGDLWVTQMFVKP